MSDRLKKELAQAYKENEQLGVRLTLAQAWVQFLQSAYDALLHHGVNYQTLKEYTESTELDDAQKLPLTAARDRIIQWLGRLQSAIHAAVRRKQFKVYDNPPN